MVLNKMSLGIMPFKAQLHLAMANELSYLIGVGGVFQLKFNSERNNIIFQQYMIVLYVVKI